MGHFIFSLLGLKRILFTNIFGKPHLVMATGFTIQGIGFRVYDSVFGVWRLGSMVCGLEWGWKGMSWFVSFLEWACKGFNCLVPGLGLVIVS